MHQQENTSILMVDDEPQILKSVGAILREEGCRVDAYLDPAEALSAFEKNSYDAVLSDIRMPGMDGIELMDRLRLLDPEVPVILHTGFADLDSAVEAVKRDAFDYLIKPTDPELLSRTIERAVLFRKCRKMEQGYQKRLEEEVQAATVGLFTMVEELKEARDVALAASQLKSQFLANLNHELRTPLNGISGSISLLQGLDLGGKPAEYLAMLEKSAKAMTMTINNIFEVAAMDAGRIEDRERNFDLDTLLDGLRRRFGREAAERGIQFLCSRTQAAPHLLWGDSDRLGKILVALLDNAVKFTDCGSVSLAVSSRPPENGEDVQLAFTVIDTGCGIPEDKLKEIFEAFRQADCSSTRRHGGLGLGLAVAKRLIALLGGELRVKSTPGQGTLFSFTARFRQQAGQ